MTKKLKDLLSEVFEETQKVDRHKVSEGVRNFGIVGKSLYNNNNIMKVAEQLAGIAEQAHHHILGEQDDWFDKISVNKNMKSLKGNVMEFQKTAKEAHMLNQRLTGLYEDIGHVLNRYYEIDEDKGDMDNDGINEPDDEEYMDNKDKAIKKAMNKEAVGDADNRDMVDNPDSPKKDGRDNENEALDVDKTAYKGDEPDYPARDGDEMREGAGGISSANPDNEADDTRRVPGGEGRELKNEDKGDMDKDGKDEPDDEEYLDNKDKAIKKAMGETFNSLKKPTKRLKDIGNVSSGIPSLGQFVNKFRK